MGVARRGVQRRRMKLSPYVSAPYGWQAFGKQVTFGAALRLMGQTGLAVWCGVQTPGSGAATPAKPGTFREIFRKSCTTGTKSI